MVPPIVLKCSSSISRMKLRNIQPFGAYEYQVLLVDTTVDFGTEIATRPSVTNGFDFCQSP